MNAMPTMMPTISPAVSRAELVEQLRRRVEKLEGGARRDGDSHGEGGISSGCAALDRRLPRRGFRRGSLVEWLAEEEASGAGTLALGAAREACREGGTLVVMDRQRTFYPPAAAARGVDLANVIVVQAACDGEELWALDQVLRCAAVAAVWAPCGQLDWRDFRRLQLAAETGGTLGLLLRPATARGQPSWADVQLLVTPRPGRQAAAACVPTWQGMRVQVEITRCRGSASGQILELELDDDSGQVLEVSRSHETHPLHSPASLAASAAVRRAHGA